MTILMVLILVIGAFSNESSQVLNKRLLLQETKCQNGFTLNENSKCVQFFMEECLEPSCNNCSNGFYSFNGFCLMQSVENCVDYERNTNNCMELTDGLGNARSLNVSPDENCLHKMFNFSFFTFCMSCQKDYWRKSLFSFDGNHCVKQEVPYCKDYANNSPRCLKCIDGYKEFKGLCTSHEVTSNCQYIDAKSGECTVCENLFWMQEDKKCVAVLDKKCKKNIENKNFCVICIEGYESVMGKCELNTKRNCLQDQFDSKTKKCKKCESMYVPRDGLCVLVTAQSCSSTDGESDNCSSCISGMIKISNGSCATHQIQNCISDNSESECTKCKSLFYLDGKDKCSPLTTTQHCVQSDGIEDRCQKCTSGHYPNSDGGCVEVTAEGCETTDGKGNFCLSCPSGHFNNSNRDCQKIDLSNCKEQYPGHPVCKICNDNYYLTEKLTCARQNLSRCTAYKSNENICTACQDEYLLAGGTCWRKTYKLCRGYYLESTGRCYKCYPMYFQRYPYHDCEYIGDYWQLVGCRESRNSDYSCVETYNGYYYVLRKNFTYNVYPISINNCVFNINMKNECKVCEPGYYPDDKNLCVPL